MIAIFDRNGVYSGQSGKAHTALYVRQSSEGIEVVHQYKRCGTIKGTLIRFGGGKLAEFSTDDFKVQVAHSTVPSLRFPDQRFPDHRSGVSRKNVQGFPVVTPEDDADNYYVVEQRATRNVNQNPEDFVVHISRSTAPNL